METSLSIDRYGLVAGAEFVASPNFDARPADADICLVVIHNISLPPGEYGGPGITQLFTNRLDPDEHPYYADIHQLKVSAHFVIGRDGRLQQFVPCEARAWHAGASSWQGRERCNDFSIGIELEGSDAEAFTAAQYATLHALLRLLTSHYPIRDIVGHSDIAPGRKTDPGPHFDWASVANLLPNLTTTGKTGINC
ncbi:1,6-anhydro-N-acetylmuramyl-L-alanine amidase AmpD [Methylobacillus pratensis]